MDLAAQFFDKGWCRFPFDPDLFEWTESALSLAQAAISAPGNKQWLRCGGTWFVGVNALENDTNGAVNGGPPLAGRAVDFIRQHIVDEPVLWDRAQVSVCYPGYPHKMARESEASHHYRKTRDAAHLDGLLPEGPDRRRHLREPHAFILGVPMAPSGPGASPAVVYERSHHLAREMLEQTFSSIALHQWGDTDITDQYQALRGSVFDSCKRVEVHAHPGEAYLIHRLALHGMAPWEDGLAEPASGRIVCYFRPSISDLPAWIRHD